MLLFLFTYQYQFISSLKLERPLKSVLGFLLLLFLLDMLFVNPFLVLRLCLVENTVVMCNAHPNKLKLIKFISGRVRVANYYSAWSDYRFGMTRPSSCHSIQLI